MKNIIFICLAGVVIAFFTSCLNNVKSNADNITQIELATGYCHGECVMSAIRIDSSLKYEYYGGMYSAKKGYSTGKISNSYWDTITTALQNINYKKLDTLYNHTVDDQSLEIIIHYKNGVKHIFAQSESLPDNVGTEFLKIADSYKHIKLIPHTDSIHFNTRVQFLPKSTSPLFPPPKP